VPQLDPTRVDDVIVGNAVPEAEQGLQVGRIIAAKAVGFSAPGITINRYCASGLESIAMATAKIRTVLPWLPQKLEPVWPNVLLPVVPKV